MYFIIMGLSQLSKVAPVREADRGPDGAWGGARPHFLAHIWQRLSLALANTCRRINSVSLLTGGVVTTFFHRKLSLHHNHGRFCTLPCTSAHTHPLRQCHSQQSQDHCMQLKATQTLPALTHNKWTLIDPKAHNTTFS